MSATLPWHQHPGLAVRWALLLAVLAAHAAVLWFWPLGRPQAVAQQITPVRVVMVDEGAAPSLAAMAATEAPPQRPATARQVAHAIGQQDPVQAGAKNAPQAAQLAAQRAAPSNVLAPPPAPVSTQANAAPAKPPSGESPATTTTTAMTATPVAPVRATGAMGNTSNTGTRVDGPPNQTPTSSALTAPGLGTVAAAPSAGKTMQDLCPHTVKAVPPARAMQAGLGGMVLARASIQGGKVRRVEILKSEPGGLYDAAVRAAMAQYVCRDQGELEILAEQLFEFKVVE